MLKNRDSYLTTNAPQINHSAQIGDINQTSHIEYFFETHNSDDIALDSHTSQLDEQIQSTIDPSHVDFSEVIDIIEILEDQSDYFKPSRLHVRSDLISHQHVPIDPKETGCDFTMEDLKLLLSTQINENFEYFKIEKSIYLTHKCILLTAFLFATKNNWRNYLLYFQYYPKKEQWIDKKCFCDQNILFFQGLTSIGERNCVIQGPNSKCFP